MRLFTIDGLKEKDLKHPPVPDCECSYCTGMLVYGYALKGHYAPPSHRLANGNEAHNPENMARLAMRDTVSEKDFLDYVAKPGGARLWFQAPKSGLWYAAGRLFGDKYAGHYVTCHIERDNDDTAPVQLCLPPNDSTLPLASIALAQRSFIMNDELTAWETAALTPISGDNVHYLPQFLHPALKRYGLQRYL